uniref:Protein SCO1, mitochondrial n=1 Tax=Lygus hesperus TaxID=30085 RepID=A0A0A9Y0X4_LYGHE
MCKALQIVKKTNPGYYELIVPIFITVDTRRDTPEKLQEYAKHFTPNMVWLTGCEDNIAKVAKKYRVHYTVPDDIEGDEPYNVDHSIFFYFMDRNTEFLDFYGQNASAQEMAASLVDKINTDMGRMDM